jgi:hypothetical protein
LDALLGNLTSWFKANPAASFEKASTLSDKNISATINHKEEKHAA